MKRRLYAIALLVLFAVTRAPAASTGGKISVRTLTVVVDHNESQPVRYAVDELVDFAGACGNIRTVVSDVAGTGTAPRLLVGRRIAEKMLGGERVTDLGVNASLDSEGFVLIAPGSSRPPMVLAAGWTGRGTRWAVYEFIKSLDVTTSPPSVALPLNRRETPDFSRRGMYAHQHWDYRFPYALRTWQVEDWERYVDVLAYFRYNLVQIWSMAGILPVPLSPADEAVLRKYPAVIEHARRNHGMEVWIGECANNVCERRDLPPFAERDYFEAETRKDPGDPAQFRQIMNARKVFYTTVDEADGYWVLDSDPGGWPGSPTKEFVDILVGNRRLIDTCTRSRRSAELVYWMWQGWGTDSREANWLAAVRGLERSLRPKPWYLACKTGHIGLIRKEGLEARTVYFPYNAVEPEPSTPYTHVVPQRLRDAVAAAVDLRDFPGIMGNSQTPLVQLPNLLYFGEAAWSLNRRNQPREEVAHELARFIFPFRENELAEGWLALSSPDPTRVHQAGAALEHLVVSQSLGPPGPVGRKISPRPDLIVEDLAMMLRTHALGMEFRKKAADPNTADEEAIRAFRDYILQTIAWRHRTGFKKSPWDPCTSPAVYSAAHKRWGTPEGHQPERILRPLREAITARYGSEEALYTLEPIGPKTEE